MENMENAQAGHVRRHGISLIALVVAIICSCILPSCGASRSITEQVQDAMKQYRFVPTVTGSDSLMCVGFRLSDTSGHELIATDGAPLILVEPLCVSWESILTRMRNLNYDMIVR